MASLLGNAFIGFVIMLCASGCSSAGVSQSERALQRDQVRRVQTDISVRGRVVREGDALTSVAAAPGERLKGTLIVIGWRNSAERSSGGAFGLKTKIITSVSAFDDTFHADLKNVNRAMLIFVLDGYEPAKLTYEVSMSHDDAPPPAMTIDDARVALHRSPIVVAAPATGASSDLTLPEPSENDRHDARSGSQP